ncbi:MAG: DUF4407 domain-containing protein [Saprospiraceae bacterium]
MKKPLYNFFVWAAGSDREVLDRCGQSEHIKHAGYGGLVLVPALLGLFSMVYAISTLTDKWWVYTSAGIVWAAIVFVFDRFIVSTFRKSDSPRKDMLSFLFASRLFFSIGIGIVISHPTVLLVFDDSLQQEMLSMKEEGEEALRDEYEILLQAVRTRDSILNAAVTARLEERRCKETLLLFEMSGKDTTVTCGTTSGMRQYGPRAQEIKEEITYLNREIQQLQQRTASKSAQNRAEIAKLQKERDDKIAQFRKQFSTNYLAREIALERLMGKEPGGGTVRGTMWFLILFFILIDILPVSFKAATQPGLYDRLIEGEKAFEPQATPGYERQQEDSVRKHLVDEMATRRIRDISEKAQASNQSFPEIRKDLETYVNVQTPYRFGADTERESPSPSRLDLGQIGMHALRYVLFASAQAGLLYVATQEPLFLTWFFPVLIALNAGVDQIVRSFFEKNKTT